MIARGTLTRLFRNAENRFLSESLFLKNERAPIGRLVIDCGRSLLGERRCGFFRAFFLVLGADGFPLKESGGTFGAPRNGAVGCIHKTSIPEILMRPEAA